MDLRYNTITSGKWDKLSDYLNYNFNLTELAFLQEEKLSGTGIVGPYLGLYKTEGELLTAQPTPDIGSYAFVLDAIQENTTINVWVYTKNGGWEEKGTYTPSVSVKDCITPVVYTSPLGNLVGINVVPNFFTGANVKINNITSSRVGANEKFTTNTNVNNFRVASITKDEKTVNVANYTCTVKLSSDTITTNTINCKYDNTTFQQIVFSSYGFSGSPQINALFTVTLSGVVYKINKIFKFPIQ